jgi:hypothetical protein
MSEGKKTWLWMTLLGLLAFAVLTGLLLYRYRRKPLTIAGAITVADTDVHNELPIQNVDVVVADGLARGPAKSDSLGFFSLQLFKDIRRGHPITLKFRHPNYEPLNLDQSVGDKLYIVHMTPLARKPDTAPKKPAVVIGNVRVKYSMKAQQSPMCSPDHMWKASIGSVSLDAGPANSFHDARLSCIAGPCPFTRINSDEFSRGGQKITASVLNWSDTTTFLLEAEVTHSMDTEIGYQSYPVIFGSSFSFTLPANAEGLTLEADVSGESIIFPLGPDLLLSWATCNTSGNSVGSIRNQSRVYRCELKSGYRFQ